MSRSTTNQRTEILDVAQSGMLQQQHSAVLLYLTNSILDQCCHWEVLVIDGKQCGFSQTKSNLNTIICFSTLSNMFWWKSNNFSNSFMLHLHVSVTYQRPTAIQCDNNNILYMFTLSCTTLLFCFVFLLYMYTCVFHT